MASNSPNLTFAGLEPSKISDSALTDLLHDEFQMPPREWWVGADQAFKQLQGILEIVFHDDEASSSDSGEDATAKPEGIDPVAARAAALPVLKLFRIGTHLLRVTPTNEPLVCVAFGTIDLSVYSNIFWEAVTESQLEIVVYDVYKGLCELSFGGYHFKILYRQCNELLRSYPDVLSSPNAFLKDSQNGCLHICDMVETLKVDRKRILAPNLEVAQLSYFYVRAWALLRGCSGSNDFGRPCLMPKELLNTIFSFLDSESEGSTTRCIEHCLRVFQSKYVQGAEVEGTSENLCTDWIDLLSRLRKLPMREKMGYPRYLQISVMFTCSGLIGGKWLSMVEDRLAAIPKTGTNATPNYTIWPNRLVIGNGLTGPYEGFYVIGYQDLDFPQVIEKFSARIAKDKDTAQGECFMNIKSFESTEFDAVFKICDRKWPRQPLPNPLEKDERARARISELPIRTKVKKSHKMVKVHRDSHKYGDDSADIAAIPAPSDIHVKLRPASEVLNRLKHDPRLNIDDFMVGYLDRHTAKIQEKSATSWQRDVTHEEFIPEHRIQYFKKIQGVDASEIMWDKRSRVDRIFKENSEHYSGVQVES